MSEIFNIDDYSEQQLHLIASTFGWGLNPFAVARLGHIPSTPDECEECMWPCPNDDPVTERDFHLYISLREMVCEKDGVAE